MKIKLTVILVAVVVMLSQSTVKADDGCLIWPYCGQPLEDYFTHQVYLPIVAR